MKVIVDVIFNTALMMVIAKASELSQVSHFIIYPTVFLVPIKARRKIIKIWAKANR